MCGKQQWAGAATHCSTHGTTRTRGPTPAPTPQHCQVMSRMEAGDHWVIYARVDQGQVLNDSALTSVHHRKVGNHY